MIVYALSTSLVYALSTSFVYALSTSFVYALSISFAHVFHAFKLIIQNNLFIVWINFENIQAERHPNAAIFITLQT